MEFEAYSIGIVHASICTSLEVDDAVDRMNLEHPTMISSPWSLSDDKTFSSGEANGCDCPDHPGNKHYLLSC